MKRTLRDAVYGAAVGDALGVPYEFGLRGEFECTEMAGWLRHGQPPGTWSDDTSMMLAVCDSIRAKRGKIDVEDQRKRFLKWANLAHYTPHGETFDIGTTVATALSEGIGCQGNLSNGNGSLMRIAPLAFTNATDDEIVASSAITHAHQVSCDACVVYVHIARDLINGTPIHEAVERNALSEPPFERLASIANVPEQNISSGGYVIHTLEAALWCLENTSSYAECVLAAVNLGGDTDTTACVAGALAGIAYGIDAIPSEWMDTLCAKQKIEACLF